NFTPNSQAASKAGAEAINSRSARWRWQGASPIRQIIRPPVITISLGRSIGANQLSPSDRSLQTGFTFDSVGLNLSVQRGRSIIRTAFFVVFIVFFGLGFGARENPHARRLV